MLASGLAFWENVSNVISAVKQGEYVTIFDEVYGFDGQIRPAYEKYMAWLATRKENELKQKHLEADLLFQKLGITFAVSGDQDGVERLIPFDIIPRIFSASEWQKIEQGCMQRVKALNAFLADVYGDKEILAAGHIPENLIVQNPAFCKVMEGVVPPGGIYTHISGIDIVRTGPEEFYVLEDNLRCPSGVSYMLENREIMIRLFPELFAMYDVIPVDRYPELLLETLRSIAPLNVVNPKVVVLTPGIYNSAYFEHTLLARRMGVELVEGQDLFVKNDEVFMRTTQGPQKIDVIYRRVDDEFLDPLAFRPDSLLGVPGLFSAYRNGGVNFANAVGTGVADDKSIYSYVPEMIRFYLGEEPLLGNVPTYFLGKKEDLGFVLAHLAEMVVKETRGSGGYGMLIGPKATKEELEAFREKILRNPSNYIAQPTLALSTCPTLVEEGVAPRHVDLRPFVLYGKKMQMIAGGLTRVALKKGSLVVNSSQGGGTKDTWVLSSDA